MVRIMDCEVVGIRSVSFTGKDGQPVQGCYLNCTYELSGQNDLGLGVVSVYASASFVRGASVTLGTSVRVARTKNGYELVK